MPVLFEMQSMPTKFPPGPPTRFGLPTIGDRFLPERAAAMSQCAYVPFGAGLRICIGQSFAMMEMTLIASLLLRPNQTGDECQHGCD